MVGDEYGKILYLREYDKGNILQVECARTNNQGLHFWMTIKSPIEVVSISDHEIIFKHNSEEYIYWADMSMFLKRFYSKSELRAKILDDLV